MLTKVANPSVKTPIEDKQLYKQITRAVIGIQSLFATNQRIRNKDCSNFAQELSVGNSVTRTGNGSPYVKAVYWRHQIMATVATSPC